MLEEKVLEIIQKNNLISPQDKILIGVSGGPDSMCLLNVLYQIKSVLGIEIIVAHINHMLRKEAKEETEYVQAFCNKIQVPCFVTYEDVIKIAKQEKIGTEEAGRKIRYHFFEQIAGQEKANKIATAHTANDNAETVFMNFLRGTSVSRLKRH